MLSEFKKFVMRGSVMDLAVGVIIGAAFGKIVDSLVNDIIMPIVEVFGKADFSKFFISLDGKEYATLGGCKESRGSGFGLRFVCQRGSELPDSGVHHFHDREGGEQVDAGPRSAARRSGDEGMPGVHERHSPGSQALPAVYGSHRLARLEARYKTKLDREPSLIQSKACATESAGFVSWKKLPKKFLSAARDGRRSGAWLRLRPCRRAILLPTARWSPSPNAAAWSRPWKARPGHPPSPDRRIRPDFPEPFCDVHLVGMEISVFSKPAVLYEIGDVHHQSVSFPVADGIAIVGRIRVRSGARGHPCKTRGKDRRTHLHTGKSSRWEAAQSGAVDRCGDPGRAQ